MDKYFNNISIVFGLVGGFFCNFLGGWDLLLKSIVILMVLHYVTGLLKSIYNKKLSSEVGVKGIIKKIKANITAYYPSDEGVEGGYFDTLGNLVNADYNTCACPKEIIK